MFKKTNATKQACRIVEVLGKPPTSDSEITYLR